MEDRTVPTIIYNPVFGVETTSQDDGEVSTQPAVYLLFWGQYWTTPVGASQIPLVQNATSGVITSTFPTIVNQYGADGTGMTIGGTGIYVQNNSDPSNFDGDDVDDAVWTLIDNGTFPEPDADPLTNQNTDRGDDHSRIYVVITPPNVQSSVAGASGFNQVEDKINIKFLDIDVDDTGECWVWTGTNRQPGRGGRVAR